MKRVAMLGALLGVLFAPALALHHGHDSLLSGPHPPDLVAANAAFDSATGLRQVCPLCLAAGQARAMASSAGGSCGGTPPAGQRAASLPETAPSSFVGLIGSSPRAPPRLA